MKLRELQMEEVDFHFSAIEEDQWPASHFDDDELVAQVTKDIRDYGCSPCPAWFCAKVWATWKTFRGDPVYLGCCSYESYDAFIHGEQDDYFLSMKQDALDELNKQLQNDLTPLLDLVILDNGASVDEAEEQLLNSNVWGSPAEEE